MPGQLAVKRMEMLRRLAHRPSITARAGNQHVTAATQAGSQRNIINAIKQIAQIAINEGDASVPSATNKQ